jgi:hypothetical protein
MAPAAVPQCNRVSAIPVHLKDETSLSDLLGLSRGTINVEHA